MIADIERAEKELDFANRKIKQLDSVVSKQKIENEQLKSSKQGLSQDLQKLMTRRKDIENLQTTLMGIMSHSGGKKIDVEDLKSKLAESVRKDKSSDITLKKGAYGGAAKKMGGHKASNSDLMGMGFDQNASINAREEAADATPAWYSSLKKNLH